LESEITSGFVLYGPVIRLYTKLASLLTFDPFMALMFNLKSEGDKFESDSGISQYFREYKIYG
jgi:hypothetical protein